MFALALLGAGLTASAAGPLQCRVLVAAKSAGDPVFVEDTAMAPCPDRQPKAVLRYDARRKLTLARSDLAAGCELGRAYLAPRPAVAAGESVQLTVSIGHVTIARAAVALETAQDGQNFFARSGDGQVFVAPPIRKVETPGKLKNER